MTQLHNKVAIITGAASGIGKEIARRFAEEGAKVVIADLILPAAETAVAEFTSAGHTALAVAMDVSDEAAVEVGVAAAVAAYGNVDILVSNAGIQIVHPLDEFPFAEWKKMLAIHLDGAFLITKACSSPGAPTKRFNHLSMGGTSSWQLAPISARRRAVLRRRRTTHLFTGA
jgi:3-hydroxybutyrate dehydrogenase